MTGLFTEPEGRKRRPMFTIGVSAAGVMAAGAVVVKLLAGGVFAPTPANATTLEDVRKILVDHQTATAALVRQNENQQQFYERIEKLLRVMCIQQAKDAQARGECLR